MRIHRLIRCLRLLQLLEPHARPTIDKLASELGVSRAQVARDLALLRKAGFPVRHSKQSGGYYSPTPREETSPMLSQEELLSLIIGSENAPGAAADHDLDHAIGPDAEKMLLAAVKPWKSRVTKLLRLLKVQRPFQPAKPKASDRLRDRLARAVDENRTLRILYRDEAHPSQTAETQFTPHALFVEGPTWTVTGRSSRHRSRKSFSMNDILRVELLPDEMLPVDKPATEAKRKRKR